MTDDIRFDDYEFELFNLASKDFDLREEQSNESAQPTNEHKRKSDNISNMDVSGDHPSYQPMRLSSMSLSQNLSGKIDNLSTVISSLENELKDTKNVRIKVLKNIYQNQVNVYSQQMNPTKVENRKRRMTDVLQHPNKISNTSNDTNQPELQNVIPREVVARFVKFAKYNMYEEFLYVLDKMSIPINAYNYDGTPLIFSAIHANTPLFIKKFEHMCNNFAALSRLGQTILHYAVLMNANMRIISYIVEMYPFMKNHPDVNGDTPLHLAIRCKNIDLVKFLVPFTTMSYLKSDGMSYLHAAIIESSQEIIDIMMTKCRNTKYNGNTTFMLSAMYNRKLSIDMICSDDFTALNIHDENVLFCLVRGGHVSLMKAIIVRNPSLLDQVNIAGRSILHYAARKLHLNDFVDLYLQCSTDIHNHKCDEGWNILSDAIVYLNHSVSHFLFFMGHKIQKGYDLKSCRDYSEGLVHFVLSEYVPNDSFITYLSRYFST